MNKKVRWRRGDMSHMQKTKENKSKSRKKKTFLCCCCYPAPARHAYQNSANTCNTNAMSHLVNSHQIIVTPFLVCLIPSSCSFRSPRKFFTASSSHFFLSFFLTAYIDTQSVRLIGASIALSLCIEN